MHINKPVEDLVGTNYGIVRQKLGRIHCCTPVREAIRGLGVKYKEVPKPLRRGFIKCVIETLAEYRGTYFAVMTGRF
jgi:hypothetical protein